MLLSHDDVCLVIPDSACCFCTKPHCVETFTLPHDQSWSLRRFPDLCQHNADGTWLPPVLCGDCHALIICTCLTCAECHKVGAHDHHFSDVDPECWPDCPTIFEPTAPLCGDCFDVLNQVECEVCGKPTSATERHVVTQTAVDDWTCRPEYAYDPND